MLSELPVVKCFLRPLIPVAAAHLIIAKRPDTPAQPLEAPASPAEPPASSSASAA
jgi:hypothetical protein